MINTLRTSVRAELLGLVSESNRLLGLLAPEGGEIPLLLEAELLLHLDDAGGKLERLADRVVHALSSEPVPPPW